MTNRHFWAYCTCGWITFAANEPFVGQLVRRHLDGGSATPSCEVTLSRQTPDDRERAFRRLRELEFERMAGDDSGVPVEVQDSPTTSFPRGR